MEAIKYRAWNKQENRWATHNEHLSDINVSASVRAPSIMTVGSDKYDLQIFTGLKDKNGVEIYEGDIFKSSHDFGPGGMHERISSVAFDLEKGYQWEYWDLDTIEVIGNIYENPELLDQ